MEAARAIVLALAAALIVAPALAILRAFRRELAWTLVPVALLAALLALSVAALL